MTMELNTARGSASNRVARITQGFNTTRWTIAVDGRSIHNKCCCMCIWERESERTKTASTNEAGLVRCDVN